MERGYYIQISGPPNTGKTTQARFVCHRLRMLGFTTEYLKLPRYDVGPEGPIIDRYLRDPGFRERYIRDHPEDHRRTIQEYCVRSRHKFEPQLAEWLDQGVSVVVEDGILESMAWHIVHGFSFPEAFQDHQGLRWPDVEILLNERNERRFRSGIEEGHAFEDDDQLSRKVQRQMLELYDISELPGRRVDFSINEGSDHVFARVRGVIREHIPCLARF